MTIINDILDFSKIEAGKIELEILEFDLRTCAEDVADLLAPEADEKGLDIIVEIDPRIPRVLRGDPGRIRQILTNLLGNAIKFTHKGEVVVHAALERKSESRLIIHFSVTDTGIGISKSESEVLFHQFSQADASTTRKFGCTVLGLAISQHLSELIGGETGM